MAMIIDVMVLTIQFLEDWCGGSITFLDCLQIHGIPPTQCYSCLYIPTSAYFEILLASELTYKQICVECNYTRIRWKLNDDKTDIQVFQFKVATSYGSCHRDFRTSNTTFSVEYYVGHTGQCNSSACGRNPEQPFNNFWDLVKQVDIFLS